MPDGFMFAPRGAVRAPRVAVPAGGPPFTVVNVEAPRPSIGAEPASWWVRTAASGNTRTPSGETQRGSTEHFNVYYENALGDAVGSYLADAVLMQCENAYEGLSELFGGTEVGHLPFSVHIRTGFGSAWHNTCADTTMQCEAGEGNDGDAVTYLVVAEAAEAFMAYQNRGWNCGASNGEALSRLLAETFSVKTPSTYEANAWLNSTRPNFVIQTDPTDQDIVSIGCGMLFLHYLMSQLEFTLDAIVEAGGDTLAQTSVRLGGPRYPFEPFALLLEVNYPSTTPATLVPAIRGTADPFPLPLPTIPLSGIAHLQGIGDVPLANDVFVGTQGESRRLEGFAIKFDPPVDGLSMEYMAHLQGLGDTGWVPEGEFVGTRHQKRRLEGFAIRLTGPEAAKYSVMYMAHLEGLADTEFFYDGDFCGTRHQSRRAEGLLVHVVPPPPP